MAINVFQQPSAVAFCGDPIITKARTTLVGKTFLRMILLCQVKATRASEEFAYEEKLSYYIGDDGIATFNVGNIVQNALNKYNEQGVDGSIIHQKLYAAKYQLTYKEVYLNGIHEEEGTTVVSEWYNAIIGGLTEFERMTMPNENTAEILGEGRFLTRKPKGEIVPSSLDFYLPAVSTSKDHISYTISQNGETFPASDSYTGGVYVPVSIKVNLTKIANGSFRIDSDVETGKEKILVIENKSMRHFLFINGFGLIESATAIMRESLSYSIESETYIVPSEINFKGYTRIVSYSKTPQVQLDMSSGYANREWAEWWVNEFLPTRMAWMLMDGRYIPVAIIPEKDTKLFDRSKPGMMAVQFKVQYSFAGGTYNSFIK